MVSIVTYDSFSFFRKKIHEEGWNLVKLEEQRPLSESHVSYLQNSLYQCYLARKNLYFGTIDFCVYGPYVYCIDGQHRMKALEELEKRTIRIPLHVTYIPVRDMEEIREIYHIRNKTILPHVYSLHPELGMERNGLINQIHEFLNKEGKVFKNSENCHRPNIKINRFLDSLFSSCYWSKIQSREDFISLFNTMNQRHHYFYITLGHLTDLSEKTLKKVIENGIFFSLVPPGENYFPRT